MSRHRRTKTAVLAVLWGLVSVTAGCASNDRQNRWEGEVREAQSLHDRGDLSTAERRYRELLARADDDGDRRFIRLQIARLTADQGQIEEALETYRSIWTEPTDEVSGARAMHEASRLLAEKREHPDEARDLKRRLIVQFPKSSWAERAVGDLVAHYAQRGAWSELGDEMDALYEEVRETSVAEQILQSVGETLWRKGDRPEAALAYFHRVLDRHPEGLTVDDAEWAAGQIYMRRQDWNRARSVLEPLAERVRSSWLVGTFNSPHASKARYALGRIHLLFLDDYAEAIDHFEQYLADFPRNRRTDDSVLHLAQAHRLAGDTDAYRRSLERLIDEFPESRHVDTARRELRSIR